MPFINKNNSDLLQKLIEEHNIITLFRHERADGDAYGSQYGIAYLLKRLYPAKQIYCLGDNGTLVEHFALSDEVADETIQNSLAIVTDTASARLLSDHRALQAKVVVKIDHHLDPKNINNYGNYNFVYPHASSACEIVADWFYHWYQKTLPFEVAQALYIGLLTDTLNFTIASVSSHTLKMASYLLESGIKVDALQSALFDIDDKLFAYQSYLRSNYQMTRNGFIYCVVERDKLTEFEMDYQMAKEQINVFRPLKKAQIWSLVIRNKFGSYNVSLRSKKIAVNQLAMHYGGGGHALACAVRNLSKQQVECLIHDVDQLLVKMV